MTAPQPLPPYDLAPLVGVRPPWSWANLLADEAETLDESLDGFVQDYNATMALAKDQVIPLCWRQHPYMNQVLPVLFFGWVQSHRDQNASIVGALEWHRVHLRAFQERIGDFLGTSSASCQAGTHVAGDHELAAARAAQARNVGDLSVRGPSILGDLPGVTFGAD